MRRRFPVLVAALGLVLGACNGDDVELAAFDGTAEVVAVEPDAQPAEQDTTGGTISGAVILDETGITGLDDCAATDDGFRVFVEEDTRFTPAGAGDDLASLRGRTVRVSGRVTKNDDVCTPIAEAVAAQGAGGATSSPGEGAGTATAAPGTTDDDPGDDATAPPAPTTTPNDPDDEGSITEPDQTASPRPPQDDG